MWIVKYRGFLQNIERVFTTRERAIQWAQQSGVYRIADIFYRDDH